MKKDFKQELIGTIHLSMLTFNQPLQPVLLTVDLPTEK